MIGRSGNTIIEVLIAATLISTAILASLALSSSSQKQTDFSRDTNLATSYNNQALDYFRNLRRENGWEAFVNELTLDGGGGSVTYCLSSLPDTLTEFAAKNPGTCDPNNADDHLPDTAFLREVTFTLSGTPVDSVTAVAATYWDSKLHHAAAETVLTKW